MASPVTTRIAEWAPAFGNDPMETPLMRRTSAPSGFSEVIEEFAVVYKDELGQGRIFQATLTGTVLDDSYNFTSQAVKPVWGSAVVKLFDFTRFATTKGLVAWTLTSSPTIIRYRLITFSPTIGPTFGPEQTYTAVSTVSKLHAVSNGSVAAGIFYKTSSGGIVYALPLVYNAGSGTITAGTVMAMSNMLGLNPWVRDFSAVPFGESSIDAATGENIGYFLVVMVGNGNGGFANPTFPDHARLFELQIVGNQFQVNLVTDVSDHPGHLSSEIAWVHMTELRVVGSWHVFGLVISSATVDIRVVAYHPTIGSSWPPRHSITTGPTVTSGVPNMRSNSPLQPLDDNHFVVIGREIGGNDADPEQLHSFTYDFTSPPSVATVTYDGYGNFGYDFPVGEHPANTYHVSQWLGRYYGLVEVRPASIFIDPIDADQIWNWSVYEVNWPALRVPPLRQRQHPEDLRQRQQEGKFWTPRQRQHTMEAA